MHLTICVQRVIKRAFSDAKFPRALLSLKPKSTRNTVQVYVDSCRVRAVGGNGGDGCISFLSAWCKEHAGPDGGDGGHGGHVIFRATHSVKSLSHCSAVLAAKPGEKGTPRDCSGKNAPHYVLDVPLGTIVMDHQNKVLGDLSTEGLMFVAARGGAGGRGNRFFLTDTEQAPDLAELGAAGETNHYELQMRSMAHVGLIGFPNAGKSSLLRAISRARPKVAPYPFTTRRPQLGVVRYEDHQQVAVADLPGLVAGAHRARGLGIQFLQHAQRCAGFLFLVDASLPRPWEQVHTLMHELRQFDPSLAERARVIVANKMDLPESHRNADQLRRRFRDDTVLAVSAKTGANLPCLLEHVRHMYDTINNDLNE